MVAEGEMDRPDGPDGAGTGQGLGPKRVLDGSLVQQQVSSLNASNPRMTSAGYQASNGRIQSLGTDANAYLMNHGRLDRLRSPPARHGGTKVQLHTVGEYKQMRATLVSVLHMINNRQMGTALALQDGMDRTGSTSHTARFRLLNSVPQ